MEFILINIQTKQFTASDISHMIVNSKTNVFVGSVFRNMKFRSPTLEKVWLPTMSGYVHSSLNDICYFKEDNMVTQIYRTDGCAVYINGSLKVIEEDLMAKGFVRIHRSYLVNVYNICKYVKKRRRMCDYGMWITSAN